MPQKINISSPSTVYVQFTGEMPRLFVVYDLSGEVNYFRYLNGQVPRIKFRMPVPGMYHSDNDFQVIKTVPIEIPDNLPLLPAPERDRWKDISYVYNPSLTTVARIHTDTGVVEHGPRYKALTRPMQIFIDEHEKGHFFYKTESLCDLYALVNFIRMGYNESTAYYILSNVIKRSSDQMERVKQLFKNIEIFQPNFNPGI